MLIVNETTLIMFILIMQLWVAATGEILESVCEHSNQITHCTITEDGSLLISSSEDTTCNVSIITMYYYNYYYSGEPPYKGHLGRDHL